MILWEIARASAFVALACYTLVVAWGIALAGRGFRPAAPAVEFHRFLSSLGLAALGTHVGALLLDSYSKVHLTTLAGINARPGVLAGVAAMWLVIALPFSMRLRRTKLISFRVWRRFHYFGYAVWVLAMAHGLATGTDRGSPYALAAYIGSAILVLTAAWWRWMEQPAPAREQA